VIKTTYDSAELAAFIGSSEGYLETLKTPVYLDDLLNYSHAKVTPQFDAAAAAYAMSTKNLGHVYEWGTAGINEGGTMRLDPLSPGARLWHHLLRGRGSHRTIDFEFRASVVPVPPPDPDAAGIDSNYANKLSGRKHIFYWKAPMMEYGIPVVIKPKYAKALFIPLNGQYNGDNFDAKRGFTMTTKAIQMVPGEKFRGMFSAFWEVWWNTQGEISMVNVARAVAEGDTSVIANSSMEARAYAKGGTKKTFMLSVSSSKATAKMKMAAAQAKRRGTYKRRRARYGEKRFNG
jgi:hypothetical protein